MQPNHAGLQALLHAQQYQQAQQQQQQHQAQQQQQAANNAQHSAPSTPQSQTPTMHGGPPTPTPVHHGGAQGANAPNPQQAVMFAQGPGPHLPHSAPGNQYMPVMIANQGLHGAHPGVGVNHSQAGPGAHHPGAPGMAAVPLPVVPPPHFQPGGPPPQGRV